jgi:hypothetical protein
MISSLRALLAWLLHARRWAMPDATKAATHEIRARAWCRADPSIVGQAAGIRARYEELLLLLFACSVYRARLVAPLHGLSIDLPAWSPAGRDI